MAVPDMLQVTPNARYVNNQECVAITRNGRVGAETYAGRITNDMMCAMEAKALLASIWTGSAGSLNRCNTIWISVRKFAPPSPHFTLENCWTIQHPRYLKKATGLLKSGKTLVQTNVPLSPGGTYTLKITDTFGDGLCCKYGAGNETSLSFSTTMTMRMDGSRGKAHPHRRLYHL